MSVSVRQGTPVDVEAVLGLWAQSATVQTVTDDREGLEAVLRRDADALLVAELDGELVGSLICLWDGWRAGMYRLAVAESARRQGVASALVAAGEERLRAVGARRIQAIVVEEEAPAMGFWTRAGYHAQPEVMRFVKNV